MKKTSKKIVVLALAMVMILSISLAGCGGEDSGSSSNGGGEATSIKIGYVAPFTGPLSVFTVATKWAEEKCLAVINDEQGGIEIDGKKIPIEIIYGDSESDPTKASEVSQKLVLEDKVDILVGAWTPDTTMSVAATGEKNKIPTYISNSPADSWLSGGPYHWSMGAMFYLEGFLSDAVNAFDKLDTNKTVGFIYDNEVDGVTMAPLIQEMFEAKGFTVVDPGRFPKGTNDYTSLINELRNGGCEVVIANMIGPDFQVLWKQMNSQGYIPKGFNIGKAVHFQADVDALGEGMANGIMSEVLWHRDFPFSSPVLGLTCEELASLWEEEQGTQYPATIGYDVTLFEILSDALTRAGTLDKETVREAILATDMDTSYGHLTFDDNQVAEVPCVTVQWLEGETWSYEKSIVASDSFPIIPAVDPVIIPNTTLK